MSCLAVKFFPRSLLMHITILVDTYSILRLGSFCVCNCSDLTLYVSLLCHGGWGLVVKVCVVLCYDGDCLVTM